ncbi:MAG TPA: hypothetical protein VHU89_07350 [Acidobacteriaceae bacterium]|jgi:hypothetical protein|nr:hypothetical protein [Acidobacteriaceae bacterium]
MLDAPTRAFGRNFSLLKIPAMYGSSPLLPDIAAPAGKPRVSSSQGATSLLPDRMDEAERQVPEVKIDIFENTPVPESGQLLFS